MTNRTIIILPGALYHWVFFQYIYTPVTWCTVTELPSKTFTFLLPGVLYHWVFIRYIYTPVTWCTVSLGFHHIHLHSCYLVHCITEFSSDTLTLLLPGTLSLGFLPIHLHVHSCYLVHCHWAFFSQNIYTHVTWCTVSLGFHQIHYTPVTWCTVPQGFHHIHYTPVTWCTVSLGFHHIHLHSVYLVHCH